MDGYKTEYRGPVEKHPELRYGFPGLHKLRDELKFDVLFVWNINYDSPEPGICVQGRWRIPVIRFGRKRARRCVHRERRHGSPAVIYQSPLRIKRFANFGIERARVPHQFAFFPTGGDGYGLVLERAVEKGLRKLSA